MDDVPPTPSSPPRLVLASASLVLPGLIGLLWLGSAQALPDLQRGKTALAAGELCDLDVLSQSVEIGFEAPGFHRPSYGLGVMTDPRPDGLLIGHGGGGPGYAAAAFAVIAFVALLNAKPPVVSVSP